MTRALSILAVGLVLAVVAAALIAGPRDLRPVLGPTLITTTVGVLVFAAVGRRARHRQKLEDLDAMTDTPQEPDRG